ncbi:MAG: hypothetical protein KJ630_01375 [Proteobacteria bacterium]|nr:hypothetical protein [Pseudomonadota bacterium]
MKSLSRLLRPLDYVRIKHPEKLSYDLLFPFLSTLIIVTILIFLPKPVKLLGDGGLLDAIVQLLQMLTGFYIASLAAIATFKKAGMDNPMPGEPPTLKTTSRGKIRIDQLTRRRFLCLMFGYLAFTSVLLYFVGKGAILVSDNMSILLPGIIFALLKWVFITVYLFIASHLIITTLLGLYYMVDRIHRTDGLIDDARDE